MKDIKQALDNFKKKQSEKALGREKPQMVADVTAKVMEALNPVLEKIQENAQLNVEALKDALSSITISAPTVAIPDFPSIPEPKVNVNIAPPKVEVTVPEQKQIELPDVMRVMGEMTMPNIDRKNPLAVLMVDPKGNPVAFSQTATGGRGDFFTIKDIQTSSGASLIDQTEGALKITGNLTASLTASTTVSLINGDGVYYNGDNPLPVTGTFTSTPGVQVSGAADSVNFMQYGGNNVGTSSELSPGFMRVVHATDVGLSTNITNTSAIDIKQVSGSSDSVNIVSQGITLDIRQVSGGIDSVFVTGFADSIVSYQARTTNPTAKSDGADVRPSADDLGRTITRPIQVRDLISTARASLSNGTETTLISGVSGSFLDLVAVMGANNSDAAVSVDVRAVTAGNVVQTIQIPAYGTAGWAPPIPWPQDATGNNWTVDMPDITGTTVSISALFSREI